MYIIREKPSNNILGKFKNKRELSKFIFDGGFLYVNLDPFYVNDIPYSVEGQSFYLEGYIGEYVPQTSENKKNIFSLPSRLSIKGEILKKPCDEQK